jgi:hypothetical protein
LASVRGSIPPETSLIEFYCVMPHSSGGRSARLSPEYHYFLSIRRSAPTRVFDACPATMAPGIPSCSEMPAFSRVLCISDNDAKTFSPPILHVLTDSSNAPDKTHLHHSSRCSTALHMSEGHGTEDAVPWPFSATTTIWPRGGDAGAAGVLLSQQRANNRRLSLYKIA